MSHRWLKFWPQDWQSDAALRLCGLTARGMWMEMICLMHNGSPYGHLTIGDAVISNHQLGIVTGVGEREATKLVAELERAGVFSRTECGVIFSRRMVRDNSRSEEGRSNIAKRWPSSPPDTPPNRVAGRRANTPRVQEAESEAEARESCALPRDAPARKSKIPSDWFPDVDGIAYAEELGVTDLVGNIQKFVNRYTADGEPKADWQAQWKFWCDRDPDFRRSVK